MHGLGQSAWGEGRKPPKPRHSADRAWDYEMACDQFLSSPDTIGADQATHKNETRFLSPNKQNKT